MFFKVRFWPVATVVGWPRPTQSREWQAYAARLPAALALLDRQGQPALPLAFRGTLDLLDMRPRAVQTPHRLALQPVLVHRAEARPFMAEFQHRVIPGRQHAHAELAVFDFAGKAEVVAVSRSPVKPGSSSNTPYQGLPGASPSRSRSQMKLLQAIDSAAPDWPKKRW